MEIKADTYCVHYNTTNETVIFEGSLRLNGMEEYAPISDLLDSVVEKEPNKIVLNLKDLKFLNSSGISMLSKFIINVRKKQNINMIVIGTEANPWQSKSLKNLQRLMPSLTLELA
jgi:anti-anti-sigma factor